MFCWLNASHNQSVGWMLAILALRLLTMEQHVVLHISSPWIWKGASATLQSGRYTLSYLRGRYMLGRSHHFTVQCSYSQHGDSFHYLHVFLSKGNYVWPTVYELPAARYFIARRLYRYIFIAGNFKSTRNNSYLTFSLMKIRITDFVEATTALHFI